uniref:SH3 and multiple ankyrin repeat domains 3 n=1 Tax=Gasterosteus aculeatus aculeatus TaxID=481459 RepID=A0AAQ4NQG9_GASAC
MQCIIALSGTGTRASHLGSSVHFGFLFSSFNVICITLFCFSVIVLRIAMVPDCLAYWTLLFSSLGELHTISQRSYGTTFTIRPGSRHPVTRRTPSPGSGSPDRCDPFGRFSGFGLPNSPTTPPQTILKSSSLSLPQEPKEVRFVMRSSSTRSRSRSPSPSHSPGLGSPLLALRPFHQKPLHLWNKYDVGDWLESINLGEHRAGFQEHEIEGSHLPALTKEDFAELGVTRVGHRMNIERALKMLLES